MSICAKGVLCGSGEMSMRSFNGPGEDEGSGGVVAFSASCQLLFSLFLAGHAYPCHQLFRKG
jgi:hypothetical protein